MDSVAILIPTYDRYAPLADLTVRWIRRFWEPCPDIYICGSEMCTEAKIIPVKADQRDWYGITAEAVSTLQAKGFTHVFLILDDLPPVARCHAPYLNQYLPATAEKLEAVYVGLAGWDQFQPWPGTQLDRSFYRWRRMPEEFKWTFSLHPAYWNLEALASILHSLSHEPDRRMSARDFESRSGAPDSPVDPALKKASYRIAGNPYVQGRRLIQQPWSRAAFTLGLHVYRWSTRVFSGEDKLSEADRRMETVMHYINGPYPTYWSGLMHHGVRHEPFIDFLNRWGEDGMIKEFDACLEKLS